jgi:uncharacterized membrane protein
MKLLQENGKLWKTFHLIFSIALVKKKNSYKKHNMGWCTIARQTKRQFTPQHYKSDQKLKMANFIWAYLLESIWKLLFFIIKKETSLWNFQEKQGFSIVPFINLTLFEDWSYSISNQPD